MQMTHKWMNWTGFVLNFLVAALMLFAGSGKAFGFAPQEIVKKMNEVGLGDRLPLIGVGAMISGLLLLIPRTSPLGALAASSFWGGAICIHMAHHEDFAFQSVLLALTWVGAILRGSVPLMMTTPVNPTTRND